MLVPLGDSTTTTCAWAAVESPAVEISAEIV